MNMYFNKAALSSAVFFVANNAVFMSKIDKSIAVVSL